MLSECDRAIFLFLTRCRSSIFGTREELKVQLDVLKIKCIFACHLLWADVVWNDRYSQCLVTRSCSNSRNTFTVVSHMKLHWDSCIQLYMCRTLTSILLQFLHKWLYEALDTMLGLPCMFLVIFFSIACPSGESLSKLASVVGLCLRLPEGRHAGFRAN